MNYPLRGELFKRSPFRNVTFLIASLFLLVAVCSPCQINLPEREFSEFLSSYEKIDLETGKWSSFSFFTVQREWRIFLTADFFVTGLFSLPMMRPRAKILFLNADIPPPLAS
jgi:hypothetical protein